MTNLVPKALTQRFGAQLLKTKASSPKIMFVVGIAGVITGSVMACKATLKLPQTLENFSDEIDEVKSMSKNIGKKDYTKSEYNKDLAYVYAKGSLKIAKLYAPSAAITALSIGALTNSHITLVKRNASLTAAYSALQKSYDSYRSRIKEEIGEERERDIYYSAKTEKVTVDGETKEIKVVDPNQHSPYARFFDEASPNWQKNAELNRLFVQCQQNYANNLLQARGHVFLNEVYDMLGIDRSQAGQVVGWVIGDKGDNFIDFGIFEATNARFVNGWERSILLDFNVDGVIYDKI